MDVMNDEYCLFALFLYAYVLAPEGEQQRDKMSIEMHGIVIYCAKIYYALLRSTTLYYDKPARSIAFFHALTRSVKMTTPYYALLRSETIF